MKRKRRNIFIALVMSIAMMFSVMVVPDTGMKAEAKVTTQSASICFLTGKQMKYIFSNRYDWDFDYDTGEFVSTPAEKVIKIKGASYDEDTNTLTLKNFKHPNWQLHVELMGPDFKLKIVGKNTLESIMVGEGTELTMCGKGSIVINKKRQSYNAGIGVNLTSKLTVEKSVKLTVYKGYGVGERTRKGSYAVCYPITLFGHKLKKDWKTVPKAYCKKRIVLKGKKAKFVWFDDAKDWAKENHSYGVWSVKGDVYKSW